MEFETYHIVPWNIKLKFNLLKKIIEINDNNVCEQLNYDNIAWGLIEGLKTNHLVPHSASLYRILRKNKQFERILNNRLKIELCAKELNIVQINYFKYFRPEENRQFLEEIIKEFSPIELIKIPNFVFIKIVEYLTISNTNFPPDKMDAIILNSLKHENIQIRLAAFELLCHFEVNRINLTKIEIFLIENSYVEHAPFRNELLKIYTNYLLKILEILFKHIKEIQTDVEISLVIEDHFEWLAKFVKNTLKINSYQRNKFGILLFEFILNHFQTENETELRKKGALKKNFYSKKMLIIKEYLTTKNKWNFDDLEIQELLVEKTRNESSDISTQAAEILIIYFRNSSDFNFLEVYANSTEHLLNVHEFYNVEATVNTLSVAIRCHEPLWSNLNDIIYKYINFAQIYQTDLNQNFGQTIMASNEMYAYLLIFIKFQDSLNDAQLDQIYSLVYNLVMKLLDVFHADQTVLSEVPSFAEMSDALNHILNIDDVEDVIMLTDDQQILLNRIWLNIKVCSDLLYVIGSHPDCKQHRADCLALLVQILQRNRHKGVIEAAGNAVANLVKIFTLNLNYSTYIDTAIEDILESITNDNLRSSCTRRTAGLSILTYRISIGDQRKEKPLLYRIVTKFLEVIREYERIDAIDTNTEIKDSGLVIALHCLKPLVHDSSLWPHTQRFLKDLLDICFINMREDKDWNIRNGALQLYGALISKLIGQNKDVSLEDIDDRFSFILDYINKLLTSKTKQNVFQILEFISQTFVTSFEHTGNINFWFQINQMKSLFSNEITCSNYYLRNLAAKSYINLTSLKNYEIELSNFITKALNCKTNVNEIHGYILLISHLTESIKTNGQCIIDFKIFDRLLPQMNCLIQKIHYLPSFLTYPLIKSFPNCIYLLDPVQYNIGSKEIACLQYDKVHDISNKIDIFLNDKFITNIAVQFYEFGEILKSFSSLYEQKKFNLTIEIWNSIVNKLLEIYSRCSDENIKALTSDFIVNVLVDYEEVKIEKVSFTNVNPTHLAFSACFNLDEHSLNDLILQLKVNYEPYIDESTRLDTAKTLVILLRNYSLCKSIIIDLLFINYWLLLDEESQIRQVSSIFVSRLIKILTLESVPVEHAYCSVFSLVSKCLPQILLKKDEAVFLIRCLLTCQSSKALNNTNNPFAHKYIVNKLEDAYLLQKVYDQLYKIVNQKYLTVFAVDELKKYFLQLYLNLQSNYDVSFISKLKMDYIKNVKSLLFQ